MPDLLADEYWRGFENGRKYGFAEAVKWLHAQLDIAVAGWEEQRREDSPND